MGDIRACFLADGIDARGTRDCKIRAEGSKGGMILKSWEMLGFRSYMEATVEIFLRKRSKQKKSNSWDLSRVSKSTTPSDSEKLTESQTW